jgi:transcription initiation factor TFIID subunit 5
MTAYRPELIRLLWPIFVHCVLNLAGDMYTRQCDKFYMDHHERFVHEHEDELRDLKRVSMPEHMEVSAIAKAYRGNKYRLSLTSMAYNTLLQYLESKDQDGGGIIISLIQTHIRIISVNRADAGPERSLAALLSRRGEEWDRPLEDEGIPGHDPGRTEERRDPTRPNILVSLSLGPYTRDSDFMEDVRADLEDEDKNNPPEPGEQSLVDAFDEKIKQEPTEDGPKPESLPLPPPLARDVAMEVQKVREHRDRFRIDPRTGGVPPGISVCMYTFHNTFDRFVY